MSTSSQVDPAASARALLAQFDIKSSPTPVEKIAKLMGAQIRFAPLDQILSGMIHVKDGVAIIGVNALHHPNRQRFTIAHELGHLLMHKDLITSSVHVDKDFPAMVLKRDDLSAAGTDQIEIEANQFASELLMPQALISSELAGAQFDIDNDKPIEQLAKKFRVSQQALQYRIRNL